MANICTQKACIVADDEASMKELLRIMGGHLAAYFEDAEADHFRKQLAFESDWTNVAKAISKAAKKYSKLCLFMDRVDTGAEDGSFRWQTTCAKPCITVEMSLKWGSSQGFNYFLSNLDTSRYGYASIDGGEYIYACTDSLDEQYVNVKAGETAPEALVGCLGFEEFQQAEKQAGSTEPVNLNEMALAELYQDCHSWEFFDENCSYEGDDEDC